MKKLVLVVSPLVAGAIGLAGKKLSSCRAQPAC
jgi:hypothetical protein